MPALQNLNFVKPALGMPAMPHVPSRTTLVKFFNLDVDFRFFIFSILDQYKTPIFHHFYRYLHFTQPNAHRTCQSSKRGKKATAVALIVSSSSSCHHHKWLLLSVKAEGMELEVRTVGGIESCFVSLPLPLIQTLQSTSPGLLPPVVALELRSSNNDVWVVAWSGSASTSSSIEVFALLFGFPHFLALLSVFVIFV